MALKRHRIHLKTSNKVLHRNQSLRNRRLRHTKRTKNAIFARHELWFFKSEEV
ncbi:hypothetical protein RYD26_07285 [Pasteurellaceae bacterium LIM206]|nr:hypothetical protein [Pasteurellaceae bacterium LIM206]